MLEKMIEDLTIALNKNTAALMNSGNVAQSISQPLTNVVSEQESAPVKQVAKKKAAKKAAPAKVAESSNVMTVEDFRASIGDLVKPLGPLALKIGEKMAELGYEKVGSVPDADRAFVLATLTKYQRILINGSDDIEEEEDDMGFMG